jgi:hypothetical protein
MTFENLPSDKRMLNYDRETRVLANDFINDNITLDLALFRLGNRGLYGTYLAGELLLEEASSSSGQHRAIKLKRANHKFTYVQNLRERVSNNRDFVTTARASLRKQQIPIFHSMLANYRLPNQQIMEDRYEGLVRLSNSLLDHSTEYRYAKDDDAIELRGILGEMAVLLLLQRFAINELPESSWIPVQSYFSEDHGGNCISTTTKPAWDINIFTQLDKTEPIQQTYKIQVKTHEKDFLPYQESALDIININQDLSLDEKESRIASLIIRSCLAEKKNPNNCERIASMLDERTDRMLDKIDSF